MNKIFYEKSCKNEKNFKTLSRSGFKSGRYSAQEAEDLYNDFFLNSPHRNKRNKMNFRRFKLFLKIMKDQFVNLIFMKILNPTSLGSSGISAKNWRIDILRTIVNSTVEFLNSNVALLAG